jgi:hypothetical protein
VFARIGTYQWVTGESKRDFFSSPPGRPPWLQNGAACACLHGRQALSSTEFAIAENDNLIFWFCQEKALDFLFIASRLRGGQ